MARSGRGGTGPMVAAILFAVGMVIVGVLAIMFYLDANKARDEARVATDQLRNVASSTDQEQLRGLLPPPGDSGRSGTIAKQAIDEVIALRLLAGTNSDLSADTIRQQLEASGLGEAETFETALQRLQSEIRSDKQEIANLEDSIETLTSRLNAMVEQNERLLAETKQSIDRLSSNFQTRQNENLAFQESKNQAITELDSQLQNVRTLTRGEVAQLNQTIEDQRRQVAELQKRIDDLTKPSVRKTAAVRPELVPDGNIVSILEKEGMVYINRGRNDRITPGLTFEVFDRLGGIALDENGEQRGKATVEVVNVVDNSSSIARVVRRTSNTTLVEGDVLSNIVYDPDMELSFHVVGEFDLDNSGTTSQSDRRRVESMVEQWGGELTPELTYDTDFLVLGPEPVLPEPLDADEIDAQKIREFEEATVRYERYQNLVLKASELRIPVLNQNRFLVLIGYYRR